MKANIINIRAVFLVLVNFMVESFKEFFENKHLDTGAGFILRTKDLGEWAFLKYVEIENNEDLMSDEKNHGYLYEIAIACLGKAEVTKRLKEFLLLEKLAIVVFQK